MNILKCSLCFENAPSSSLVSIGVIAILEQDNNFFVVVSSEPRDVYGVRKCETFLEAGLIFREVQKFVSANTTSFHAHSVKEASGSSSKNHCEILVNKLIQSGEEYIFSGKRDPGVGDNIHPSLAKIIMA